MRGHGLSRFRGCLKRGILFCFGKGRRGRCVPAAVLAGGAIVVTAGSAGATATTIDAICVLGKVGIDLSPGIPNTLPGAMLSSGDLLWQESNMGY